MITQERLKELFYYNPEDGNLYNKVQRGGTAKEGQIAGSVHTKARRKGYAYKCREVKIGNKSYLAHRLIWVLNYGTISDDLHIDHINGNSLDNRLNNLRCVECKENAKNKQRNRNNISGVTGVYFSKRKNKWISCITHNYKNIQIGSYTEFEQAVKARKEAEKKYGFHENHCREPVQVST